jgi:peptidoglycan biosynthesis protein MviN/MurJ (putative lipid II flippase)
MSFRNDIVFLYIPCILVRLLNNNKFISLLFGYRNFANFDVSTN